MSMRPEQIELWETFPDDDRDGFSDMVDRGRRELVRRMYEMSIDLKDIYGDKWKDWKGR